MNQDSGPEGPWPCLCNERTFCWCRKECEAEEAADATNARDARRYRKWREAHVDAANNQHTLRLVALADIASAVDKALDAP
jgi:hypothetical protein